MSNKSKVIGLEEVQPRKRLRSSDVTKEHEQKQITPIIVSSQVENGESEDGSSLLRRSPRQVQRTSYEDFIWDETHYEDSASAKPTVSASNPTVRAGNSSNTKNNRNQRNRKQKKRVVSRGHVINVEGCPDQLLALLCADAKQQYGNNKSNRRIEEKIQNLWDDTEDDIKQTLPDPSSSSENYEAQMKEWKIQHFGAQHFSKIVPRGHVINVEGCPDQLIALLCADAKQQYGKISKRDIQEKIQNLWDDTEDDIKQTLPNPSTSSENYEAQMKEWKIQHFGTRPFYLPRQSKRVSEISKKKEEVPVVIKQEEGRASRSKRSRRQSAKYPKEESPSREEEKKEDNSDTNKCPIAENGPPAQPAPFELLNDPNEYYVEEEAFLYHNPPIPSQFTEGVKPEDLKAIPPPMPLPELPSTGKCTWTFDEVQRILLADFSASATSSQGGGNFAMDPKDESFFLEMLERDDITVISEGFLSRSTLNPEYWKLEYLQTVLNQEYYHKFRRFDTIVDTNGFEKCQEVDGMYSMRIGTYVEYLKKRHRVLTLEEGVSADPSFSFVDHEGKERKIAHVGVSAIYMIDLDINKLVPNLHEDFLDSFRYPGVLPGGDHCMMNSITANARPFMGPNMYVTPPAAFTHFHQDGHGTVDSGHLCLSGYNEVVLLRRLTERHKKHALMILTGNGGTNEYFDGLYQEPHQDQLGEKPDWPTQENIEKCRDMGYCPSLCILKPGQLIHINKGRLHAFRKMSTAPLPEGDCHAELRKRLIAERNLKGEELCISIAWDWMYRGSTPAGINREVCTILEAAILNRKMGRVSLAIPESSLLQMAKMTVPTTTAPTVPADMNSSMIRFVENQKVEASGSSNTTKRSMNVCRGILPSLRHVLKEQAVAMNLATQSHSMSHERGKRVSIAKRPNTHEDSMVFPVDPYGNNDFICKLCSKELSNVYFHCDGCEKLLSKDFNICQQCHSEKKFMMTVQMHPTKTKKHSLLNHTGKMTQDRSSRCPCKNGPACENCTFCSGCSCRCHTWFTLHCRFFNQEETEVLLDQVEKVVTSGDFEPNKYLDDPSYLERRFALAACSDF